MTSIITDQRQLLPAEARVEVRRQLAAVLSALSSPGSQLTAGQLRIAAAALTEATKRRMDAADACPVCASWPNGFCGPCTADMAAVFSFTELAGQLRRRAGDAA